MFIHTEWCGGARIQESGLKKSVWGTAFGGGLERELCYVMEVESGIWWGRREEYRVDGCK